MRSLTAGQQLAVDDALVHMAWFIQMDFDGGAVYLNTSGVTIPYGGHDWLAGQVIDVESIKETDSGAATGFTLSLATTSEALIARALAERTTNRPCYVWMALINSTTGALIDTPVLVEQGLCDQPTIGEDGGTAVVSISVETEMADFARPNVIRYTNADQQQRYAGDRFFEYVEQMVERAVAFPSREFQLG